MRIKLLIIALVIFCASNISAEECFLPKNLISFLDKHYPKAEILQKKNLPNYLQDYLKQQQLSINCPGFVSADLNGDGKLDYALILKGKTDKKPFRKVIFLISKKEGDFLIFPIEDYINSEPDVYLRLISPGTTITEWESRKKIYLKQFSIELTLFEAAQQVYFWDKDQKTFKFIQTSD